MPGAWSCTATGLCQGERGPGSRQEVMPVAMLEPPYEILDLADGESAEFRILRYQRGEVTIQTRLEPQGKTVPVIRVWVPPEDKPLGAPYWDITSRTLQARLEPVLDMLVVRRQWIRITKHGVAPTARHSVEFLS